MKIKMWKWVGIAALPLAAVVTLPVILTSCSSSSPEQTEQVVIYQPNAAIAEKFSEADFAIIVKGVYHLSSINEGKVSIIHQIHLVGDSFKLDITWNDIGVQETNIIRDDILLVPASEGENAGKFWTKSVIDKETVEEWRDYNDIKNFFIMYYEGGLNATN